MRPVTAFRNAVVFLTRVPIGLGRGGVDLVGAVAWFPIVGGLIGVVVGAIAAATLSIAPPLVAATLAVGAGALLTGAFHHDGLADVADAFPGGATVERRFEILKDSRLGTYGVTALIVVVLLQVSSVAALAPRQAFVALIAAHALGRSMAVVLMATMRPAARTGLGISYLEGLSRPAAATGALLGPAIAFAAVGPLAAVLVAAAALGPAIVGPLAQQKIGGVAGDVLGATEQVAETAVLVAAAILVHQGTSWPW